jgi:hypoxanthine phosphoribosyltransferase
MHNISIDGEGINYLLPSWDDLSGLCFDLCRKVIESGKKFDRIVTLAKGGWPLTRTLVDFLGVKEVASIGVKFYGGINTRLEKPLIYQKLPVDIAGEKVLLFDDVADSGESLLFTRDYLSSLGVDDVATATVFYKPHSKIKPDFYGMETDTWIIFPYEVREASLQLKNSWSKNGVSSEEVLRRLSVLGFKQEWVRYFENVK